MADPALAAEERDVPHIGHTAVRVVVRRGGDDAAAADVAEKAVAVEGVHAVLGHAAVFQQGLDLDLYLLSGDLAEVVPACRAAAPYGSDADVVLDAPFQLIDPLRYPWADRIRQSDLPKAVS